MLGDFLAHVAERLDFVIAEVDAFTGNTDLERRGVLAAVHGGRTGSGDWSGRRRRNGWTRNGGGSRGWRRGRHGLSGDDGFDVFLGDAAAGAGAFNGGKIHAVFLGETANQR